MDGPEGHPVVAIPSRLDRRLRLGPFPSGRDALKFLAYTAGGLVLLPTGVPVLALPFVAGGFLVSVWKPGGESLDTRALVRLRYLSRRLAPGAGVMAPWTAPTISRSGGLAGPVDPRWIVFRTAGVPLAYLPPAELSRRFEGFRELLRSVGGTVHFLVTSTPVFLRSLLPSRGPETAAEGPARAGYVEMTRLLLRRRGVRRVYIGASLGAPETPGGAEAEGTAQLLSERLTALGLAPERLRGRELGRVAERLGVPTLGVRD